MCGVADTVSGPPGAAAAAGSGQVADPASSARNGAGASAAAADSSSRQMAEIASARDGADAGIFGQRRSWCISSSGGLIKAEGRDCIFGRRCGGCNNSSGVDDQLDVGGRLAEKGHQKLSTQLRVQDAMCGCRSRNPLSSQLFPGDDVPFHLVQIDCRRRCNCQSAELCGGERFPVINKSSYGPACTNAGRSELEKTNSWGQHIKQG